MDIINTFWEKGKSMINEFNEVIVLQQKIYEDRQRLKKYKVKSIKRSKWVLLMIHKTAIAMSKGSKAYSNEAVNFIRKVFERNDIYFIRNVFQSLSNCFWNDIKSIIPYIPYDKYIQQLIKEDKDTLFQILFIDLHGYIAHIMSDAYYWQKSIDLKSKYSLEEQMSYLLKYRSFIFSKYHNEMFTYCRQSKRRMFIFFYLFQEYFTDEMFVHFLKVLEQVVLQQKYYNDKYLLYINGYTRYFPEKYKKQYEAFCSLHDLKE